jgi:hypothetical protein
MGERIRGIEATGFWMNEASDFTHVEFDLDEAVGEFIDVSRIRPSGPRLGPAYTIERNVFEQSARVLDMMVAGQLIDDMIHDHMARFNALARWHDPRRRSLHNQH